MMRDMVKKKPLVGVMPYTRWTDGVAGDRYFPEGYLNGIMGAGGEPKLIDYVDFPMDAVDALADDLDAMVFSGGADVDPKYYCEADWPEAGPHLPDRDELEIALLKALFARKKPILGICRGLQIINVALGGSLYQDIPKAFGTVHQQDRESAPFWHDVEIVPGTRTERIFGSDLLLTNSYHHQCAHRVAENLIVSARARATAWWRRWNTRASSFW